jgi:RNase H-fold protein (predicted Holliday junction resolvase)
LQAYERMALFLERINPSNLLIRVTPFSSDKNQYENLIIEHINQEYEHNITQQIYVTDECWTIIMTAKNTTIQNIRKTNMNEKVDSANKLREVILSDLLDSQSPSTLALAFLKDEVGRII